jgi:GAF domain-containing protein
VDYPVSGTKPLTRDGWYDFCITGQQVFVANTTPEFARYFFDHALITSLGLGSCINIPVIHEGTVLGTVNLLAEEQHFTADRLAAYRALVTHHHAALVAQMAQG